MGLQNRPSSKQSILSARESILAAFSVSGHKFGVIRRDVRVLMLDGSCL